MALKKTFKFLHLHMHRCGDVFDVACFTLPKGFELSLDQSHNAYCNVPALSTQCGDKKSVSWGDESGT